MKVKILVLLLILAGITGCGVTFGKAPVNAPLPDEFTKRAIYNGAIAGYDFQDLVGNILFIPATGDPLRIDLIRPKGYKNDVIAIPDPNNYYHSRIQRGAEAKGSYLAFAASFKDDEMAELTLLDKARAGIQITDTAIWADIKNQILGWVKVHPKADPNSQRLWVKSVVLSGRMYKSSSHISANASGQVGNVVGMSTGVYHMNDDEIKSVTIGFESFDIDKLAAQIGSEKSLSEKALPEKALSLKSLFLKTFPEKVVPEKVFLEKAFEEASEKARYKDVIKGEIKGL